MRRYLRRHMDQYIPQTVQLRFAGDKITVPLFYAASKRYCIRKRQGKSNFCTPKSLSRSRFSIPVGACCCRVVGALGSFSGICVGTVSCAGHPASVVHWARTPPEHPSKLTLSRWGSCYRNRYSMAQHLWC